jgi:hypothetical protein
VGIKVNQQYMIFGLMINHENLGVPFIFSDKHTQKKLGLPSEVFGPQKTNPPNALKNMMLMVKLRSNPTD